MYACLIKSDLSYHKIAVASLSRFLHILVLKFKNTEFFKFEISLSHLIDTNIASHIFPAFDIRITPSTDLEKFDAMVAKFCSDAGEGVKYEFLQVGNLCL